MYGKEDWEKAYSKAEFESPLVQSTTYYESSEEANLVLESTNYSELGTITYDAQGKATSFSLGTNEYQDQGQSKQTRVSNPYSPGRFDPSNPSIERVTHKETSYPDIFEPQDYTALGIRLKNKAMKEYLSGLESRFIPFRRYHIVDSDKNLISNNIIASSKNVVNAVAIHFKETDSSEVVVKEMKASSMLEDYEINQANVSEYAANIKCEEMALRYGMGSLIYGMKNMYKGEVMVLGNPRIKPWDICYLFDTYHDMFGPFEVKAVTHIFSHETGFITEIVPNAVVIGNEVSSTPVIDGLKLFLAAVRDKDNEADLRKTFQPNLKELMVKGSFGIMDARYGKDLGRKYAELNNSGVNFENIWNDIPAEDKEILKDYTKEEIFEYLTGVSAWQLKTAEALDSIDVRGTEAFATAGLAGVLGLSYEKLIRSRNLKLAQEKINFFKPEGKSRFGMLKKHNTSAVLKHVKQISNLKKYNWKALGVGALGGLGLSMGLSEMTNGEFRSPVALNTKAITLSDDLLDGDIKYLISSPILFSKFMEQEAVTIIPLIKDGTPIVSGMSLRDPMAFWQNTLGVLTNKLNDEMRGYADRSRMSLKYKNAFYKRFEQLNNEVIDDLDKRTMVQDLLVEEGYSKDAVQMAMTDRVDKWFSDAWRSL